MSNAWNSTPRQIRRNFKLTYFCLGTISNAICNILFIFIYICVLFQLYKILLTIIWKFPELLDLYVQITMIFFLRKFKKGDLHILLGWQNSCSSLQLLQTLHSSDYGKWTNPRERQQRIGTRWGCSMYTWPEAERCCWAIYSDLEQWTLFGRLKIIINYRLVNCWVKVVNLECSSVSIRLMTTARRKRIRGKTPWPDTRRAVR